MSITTFRRISLCDFPSTLARSEAVILSSSGSRATGFPPDCISSPPNMSKMLQHVERGADDDACGIPMGEIGQETYNHVLSSSHCASLRACRNGNGMPLYNSVNCLTMWTSLLPSASTPLRLCLHPRVVAPTVATSTSPGSARPFSICASSAVAAAGLLAPLFPHSCPCFPCAFHAASSSRALFAASLPAAALLLAVVTAMSIANKTNCNWPS